MAGVRPLRFIPFKLEVSMTTDTLVASIFALKDPWTAGTKIVESSAKDISSESRLLSEAKVASSLGLKPAEFVREDVWKPFRKVASYLRWKAGKASVAEVTFAPTKADQRTGLLVNALREAGMKVHVEYFRLRTKEKRLIPY